MKKRWFRKRLLDVLEEEFAPPAQSGWGNCFKMGFVTLNGTKADGHEILGPRSRIGTIVHRHEPPIVYDKLRIAGFRVSGERFLQFTTCNIAQADGLLVDKPASWPTLPSGAYNRNTMYFVLQTAINNGTIDGNSLSFDIDVKHLTSFEVNRTSKADVPSSNFQLHVLHRLDRQVSGAVLVAFHSTCAQKIQAWFEQQSLNHASIFHRRIQSSMLKQMECVTTKDSNDDAATNRKTVLKPPTDSVDCTLGKIYLARLFGDIRGLSMELQTKDNNQSWSSLLCPSGNGQSCCQIACTCTRLIRGLTKCSKSDSTFDLSKFFHDAVSGGKAIEISNDIANNAEPIPIHRSSFVEHASNQTPIEANEKETFRVGQFDDSEVLLIACPTFTSLAGEMNWHVDTIRNIVNSIPQPRASKAESYCESDSAPRIPVIGRPTESELAWCRFAILEVSLPLARYAADSTKYAAKRMKKNETVARGTVLERTPQGTTFQSSCPPKIPQFNRIIQGIPLFPGDDAILKSESIPTKTRIVPLCYDACSNSSFVLLQPVTGRTHQLRIHSAALGHPILYDTDYGYPQSPRDLVLELGSRGKPLHMLKKILVPAVPSPKLVDTLLSNNYKPSFGPNYIPLLEDCSYCADSQRSNDSSVAVQEVDCESPNDHVTGHQSLYNINSIPKKYACILLHSVGFISPSFYAHVRAPPWWTGGISHCS